MVTGFSCTGEYFYSVGMRQSICGALSFSLAFAVSAVGLIMTQGWNLLRKYSGFSISGHTLANCTS